MTPQDRDELTEIANAAIEIYLLQVRLRASNNVEDQMRLNTARTNLNKLIAARLRRKANELRRTK